jgi:hypothetical protein
MKPFSRHLLWLTLGVISCRAAPIHDESTAQDFSVNGTSLLFKDASGNVCLAQNRDQESPSDRRIALPEYNQWIASLSESQTVKDQLARGIERTPAPIPISGPSLEPLLAKFRASSQPCKRDSGGLVIGAPSAPTGLIISADAASASAPVVAGSGPMREGYYKLGQYNSPPHWVGQVISAVTPTGFHVRWIATGIDPEADVECTGDRCVLPAGLRDNWGISVAGEWVIKGPTSFSFRGYEAKSSIVAVRDNGANPFGENQTWWACWCNGGDWNGSRRGRSKDEIEDRCRIRGGTSVSACREFGPSEREAP